MSSTSCAPPATSRGSSICARRRTTRPARSTPTSATSSTSTTSRDAMTGCDAVVHLAAVRRRRRWSPTSPSGAEALNARGTLNVLEAARQAGVDRVVYASTIWVYSDARGDEVDEDTAARAAQPPLHRDEARGRDVLQAPTGALRRRVHDPALRHPLRPARPASCHRRRVTRRRAAAAPAGAGPTSATLRLSHGAYRYAATAPGTYRLAFGYAADPSAAASPRRRGRASRRRRRASRRPRARTSARS